MFFIPYGTAEKSGRKSFPFVNVLFVLANIAVFCLEILAFSVSEAELNRFMSQYAFVPASLDSSLLQPTLLTAMFLHAGIVHIIGNMIYLLPFGDNVEDRLGHVRYLFFYLVCGVAASLIFAAFNAHSLVPLVGASGAIAGVLGGYLALHPTGSTVKGIFLLVVLPLKLRLPALLFIGYWFFIQVVSSFAMLSDGQAAGQGGGVAFMAHVGGFVTGFVLAPLFARTIPDTEPV